MDIVTRRWSELARETAAATRSCVVDGFVHDEVGLAQALIDARVLAEMLVRAAEADARLDREVLLATEALLQSVQSVQSSVIARAVGHVVAALETHGAPLPADEPLPSQVLDATRALHLALERAYDQGRQAS